MSSIISVGKKFAIFMESLFEKHSFMTNNVVKSHRQKLLSENKSHTLVTAKTCRQIKSYMLSVLPSSPRLNKTADRSTYLHTHHHCVNDSHQLR